MVPISNEEPEAMLFEPLPGHGRPGVVAIGVADDGGLVGCDVSDQLLTKLRAIKEDGQIIKRWPEARSRHPAR